MTPVAYALAIQSLVFSFALLFYRQKRIPAWKNFTFGRKIIFSRRSSFNFLYKYCHCFQEKCQLFKETHLSFCTKKEYHIYRKKEIASLSNMLKITLGKIIFHSLFKKKHHIFEKKNFIFSNNTENIRLQFKLFERNIFSENVQNGIMVFDTVH